MAKSFLQLEPIKHFLPVGFPLFLMPVVAFFQAAAWEDIALPVLLLHTALACLSVFLIGSLTMLLTGKLSSAVAAALLWTVHPYLMYAVFGLHVNAADLRTVYVDHAMWFPVMSDPSSVFWVLLAVFLFFKSLAQPRHILTAGLCMGIALLVRLPNVVVAGVLVAGYLVQKKITAALIFGIGVLTLFFPQLVYNYYCSGSLFDFGYTARLAADGHRITVVFGIENLTAYVKLLTEKYPVLSLLLLACSVAVPLCVIRWSNGRRFAWTMITLLVFSYLLFYSVWWGFKYFPYRFLMPLMPFCSMLTVAFCTLVRQRLQGMKPFAGSSRDSSLK
jgi:hypothetical protein